MFKTTFRNLASHKVRFFLTCIAIVLGVGLLTGTHVLTDTVRATFDDLFDEVSGGVDLTVRAETAFENNAYGSDRELVDASIVDTVRAVDSVEVAEGSVEGYAEMERARAQRPQVVVVPTARPRPRPGRTTRRPRSAAWMKRSKRRRPICTQRTCRWCMA